APTARRLTRIDWQWDEAGPIDRWSHVHVVEARRGAKPRQLTSGNWGASKPAWAPDGRSIAFVADRNADADLRPRIAIWMISADAVDAEGTAEAEPREVISTAGPADKPAFSPNGRWLAAIAPLGDLDDATPELVVAPADGSAPAWPLAPTLDRPVGTW